MSVTIQLRRDTAANWASVNPVLNQGELGVETDTGKAKLGDGATAWASLSYWQTGSSGGGGGGGAISSVFGRTGAVTAQSGDYTATQVGADASGAASAALTTAEAFATSAVATETTRATAAEALKAPLASPALTGSPTAPTQATGDASTKIATDAFVQAALPASLPPSGTAGGSLTGSYPNPGVATLNQNTTGTAANLSGAPALPSGTTATTQATGDASTKIATDAFVGTAVAAETSRAVTAEALAVPLSTKGAASGVASLDGTGNVPLGQLGNAPSGGGGGVSLAGDLGNTTSVPQVISTHLSSALPLAQGGTAATTAAAALTSLGAASATALTAETARAEAAEALATSKPSATAVQTASYTVTANTLSYTNTSAGSLTATLPSAPPAGTWVMIKQVVVAGVGTNATTIATSGSDVFNTAAGPTSMTLTLANQSVFLQYDATQAAWIKIASDDATGSQAASRDAVYYLDSYTGTDDAKMASALAAAVASPYGGTIKLSPRAHVFASQWATAYSSGSYSQIHIMGAAMGHGLSEGQPYGPTTCDMQYAGANAARMDFQHAGSIELDHIYFKDTVGSTVPFFQTTNAEPNIHDCTFAGSTAAHMQTQDALMMGGTTTTTYTGGETGAFQGYQGIVQRVAFYNIRTGVACRAYANSISMRDLLFDGTCGSPNVFSVTDGAMTAASATLTCATSAPFTSGMVGQIVVVAGAGADIQNFQLVGRITAFTSTTAVTLSVSAVYTVSGATTVAPGPSAIMIGWGGGGVEGCVVNDCCIEVTGYPIAITLQSSQFNSVNGTSFWDGVTTNVASILEANGSTANTYMITTNAQTAGIPPVISESPGTSNIISPNLSSPVNQFVGPITMANLSGWIDFRRPGGSGLRFSQVAWQAPTAVITGDAAGDINLTPASGGLVKIIAPTNVSYMQVGCAANYVDVGPLSTGDVWFKAAGTGPNVNIQIMALGTGGISLRSHAYFTSLSGTPTIAANANAGTSPTVSVTGNDVRGIITVTTGTGTVAAGALAAVTYNATWANGTAYVVVCASNAAALALSPGITAMSSTAFTLGTGFAPATSTTYTFNYHVLG